MGNKFHIIIPVHNRKAKTIELLCCLQAQTYKNFTVYVVDDGSTDETAKDITSIFSNTMNLKIITGNGNLWWGGAIFCGIENVVRNASKGDIIVLMNDDIKFYDNFLFLANQIIIKYPNSMIGPLIINDKDMQTLSVSGFIMKCWPLAITAHPLESLKLNSSKIPEIYEIDFLGAQATFFPVQLIKKIGNVNSKLLPHYHCDGEFSYRAKRAGYKVIIHRDLCVFHSVNTTGILNSYTNKYSFIDLFRSLKERKSPNNLKDRFNFARLCCPKKYLLPFLVSDTLRIIIRSLAIVFMRGKFRNFRFLTNKFINRIEKRD